MTSTSYKRDSTMRRIMLMMQTLDKRVSMAACIDVLNVNEGTHNPPHAKIPVRIPFCLLVVRRRHSKGKGLGYIVSLWYKLNSGRATYQGDDEAIENCIDRTRND